MLRILYEALLVPRCMFLTECSTEHVCVRAAEHPMMSPSAMEEVAEKRGR